MKKILLLFIAIYAFGMQKVNIISLSNNYALINAKVKKGLTGYVIHNNIIIAKALSLGSKAKLLPFTKLKNTALATPNIKPSINDKIIFGLYDLRRLIIAPNQLSYIKTKQKYPNVTFISSDIFANYFTTKPSKEDFQNFCNDFNVGDIDFILDKEYIVDCQSFVILDTKPTKQAKYTKPFFANYKKFTTGIFSSVPKIWLNYYKSILKVNNGK